MICLRRLILLQSLFSSDRSKSVNSDCEEVLIGKISSRDVGKLGTMHVFRSCS